MSDVGLFLLLFAALVGCIGLIWLFAWFEDIRQAGGPVAYWRQAGGRYVVNTNAQPAPNVMSRSAQNEGGLAASDLQTDRQTDTRPTRLPPEVMVDICKDLRAHGYTREQARSLLRKFGQPLDNNLWSPAAPTPDAEHITPIAGRRTDAVFDADFPYQAPPVWSTER